MRLVSDDSTGEAFAGCANRIVKTTAFSKTTEDPMTKEQIRADINALPENYKTADVDKLISKYVREKANVSCLRPYILEEQDLHRIYFYVSLKQMKKMDDRVAFINDNLLFTDWWHTDQLIKFVADMDFSTALELAREYTIHSDPFIRRWGYVMFISRLCRGHADEILPLCHNDDEYYVQMAEAWLIAELVVYEPGAVYNWLPGSNLSYTINGKAIQKICDSFRISDEWKEKFKGLRAGLK